MILINIPDSVILLRTDSTFQDFFSQQCSPLSRVQLVTSPLLGLLFDHVAPGSPEGLGQPWTDSRKA